MRLGVLCVVSIAMVLGGCGSSGGYQADARLIGLVSRAEFGKARELLGWSPTVTLEEGLAKTIDFFADLAK